MTPLPHNNDSNDNHSNDVVEVITSSLLPPCRILVRTKTCCEIYTLPDPYEKLDVHQKLMLHHDGTPSTFQHISSNGQYVYFHIPNYGIIRYDISVSSSTTSTTLPSPYFAKTANVQIMSLSCYSGNYAITWERYHETTCPLNLKVWDCQSGQCISSFYQKTLSRDSWPYIRFTFDEHYMILLTTSQLRVYDTKVLQQSSSNDQPIRYIYSISLKGCTSFTVPQTYYQPPNVDPATYYLSTFTPVQKDKPASAMIYEFKPSTTDDNNKNAFTLLSSKSLFQAESCATYWAPTNDAAIVTLQTSVDATGQSYYGSSQIFLWNTKKRNDISAVPLPQDGPISSIQWIPDPTKPISFIVIAGKMPAMVSLHHGITGQPLYLFGNHVSRNSVSIAPHGRFMIVGGFGNLAGGVNFWDINKKKLLPHHPKNVNDTLQIDSVTAYEWSPNSRYLVTATCSPRMNVDNNIRLFYYHGTEIMNVPWNNQHYQPDQLLQVSFIPCGIIPNPYPDRPQSPVSENNRNIDNDVQTTAVTTKTVKATAAAAKKPTATTASASAGSGKYVPPSARGMTTGTGTSLAERLRQEKQGSVRTAGKVTAHPSGPISAVTGKAIPGLSTMPTTAKSKSAKKNKNQQQTNNNKNNNPSSNVNPNNNSNPNPNITNQTSSQPSNQGNNVAKTTTTAATPEATTKSEVPLSADEKEKRARKIKKLLKQIDELKIKDVLNDDQKSKLASEHELRQELQLLEEK